MLAHRRAVDYVRRSERARRRDERSETDADRGATVVDLAETVEGDLQRHLLEAMRQKDEFSLYRKRLPDGEAILGFNERVTLSPARVPAIVYEVMAAVG